MTVTFAPENAPALKFTLFWPLCYVSQADVARDQESTNHNARFGEWKSRYITISFVSQHDQNSMICALVLCEFLIALSRTMALGNSRHRYTVYIDGIGGIDSNYWKTSFMIYLFICCCYLSAFDRSSAKQLPIRVPSIQRLSTIAGDLGLDFEKDELAEYRG